MVKALIQTIFINIKFHEILTEKGDIGLNRNFTRNPLFPSHSLQRSSYTLHSFDPVAVEKRLQMDGQKDRLAHKAPAIMLALWKVFYLQQKQTVGKEK